MIKKSHSDIRHQLESPLPRTYLDNPQPQPLKSSVLEFIYSVWILPLRVYWDYMYTHPYGFAWEAIMNPKLWYSKCYTVVVPCGHAGKAFIIPQLGVSVGTTLGPYDFLGFAWEAIKW